MTDDRSPPPWQNERATGARKLKARPDLENPDIIHTGDPDDEPKLPYGLTEPDDDRGDAASNYDGRPARSGEVTAAGAEQASASKPR